MASQLPQKLTAITGRFCADEKKHIELAYLFARKYHHGQKRRSGSPYILHPLRVAQKLASDGAEATTVIAALLHDTIEDTTADHGTLLSHFGPETTAIVEGVTKISSLKIRNKDKIFSDDELFLEQVENYRKILMATASDLRVIVVKLYDRLDNIETIESIPQYKQKFYARETIEIFAPIAERLGMGSLKGQLEDASFPYAFPTEYQNFRKEIKGIYSNPESVVRKMLPAVRKLIEDAGIEYESVSGRAKHHFSLYKKLRRKGDISLIFDICALRIVLNNIADCYQVLGLVHSVFEPLPNQIDDYIAKPKDNGYRSIHTTVRDENGNIFEVQIRTKEMHEFAEHGIASHWNYKEIKYDQTKDKNSALEWIKELGKLKNINDKELLLSELQDQIFSDKVFTFTPTGDIIRLPRGSTPIDFAYRIHSNIGNTCVGAKINGRIVSLSTILQTADTVTILTSKTASPKSDWLKFTKTAQAKQHIKQFLKSKNEEMLSNLGLKQLYELTERFKLPKLTQNDAERALLSSRLPFSSLKRALASLADNTLTGIKFLRALYPNFRVSQEKSHKIQVTKESEVPVSLRGIRHEYAKCCKPKPDEPIVGYISKEHILKVHKQSCKRLLGVDPKRIINL